MDKISHIIIGPFVHSIAFNELEVCVLGAIGWCSNGIIRLVERCRQSTSTPREFLQSLCISQDECSVLILDKNQFLIPGLIDTHTHAPQYVNAGLGLDLPLLDWLSKYTFPRESEFIDSDYAEKVYAATVRRHVGFGSTTCCYYGTIHLEATKRLVDVINSIGQRALVGKVNMDRNSPEALTESTAMSVTDTIKFLDYVLQKQESTVSPCITPRFAPSCTPELLAALGQMAKERGVHIQSHLSESINECKWVKELFPDAKNYADVYDRFGLLTNKTIMAHGIYLDQDERRLLSHRGTGISHCPNSNFSISSGVCDVRRLVMDGVAVGLGTDVSGGHHPSMLDAIRSAILASKVLHINSQSSANDTPTVEPLSIAEAFYLATMGSAKVCGWDNLIGNFRVGKEFDAVLADITQLHQLLDLKDSSQIDIGHHQHVLHNYHDHLINNIDLWHHDDLMSSFERFVYLGDDRNVRNVWVRGRVIKKAF